MGELKHDAGHVEENEWDGREKYQTLINKKFLKILKGQENIIKKFLNRVLRSN